MYYESRLAGKIIASNYWKHNVHSYDLGIIINTISSFCIWNFDQESSSWTLMTPTTDDRQSLITQDHFDVIKIANNTHHWNRCSSLACFTWVSHVDKMQNLYLLQHSDEGMIADRRPQVSVIFIGTKAGLPLNHLGMLNCCTVGSTYL